MDTEIDELVTELSQSIKYCEQRLKQMMSFVFENSSDNQIRKNIMQTYVSQLTTMTRQLQKMEKEHLMKLKDLYGEEGEIVINEIEKREDFFGDLDRKDNDTR